MKSSDGKKSVLYVSGYADVAGGGQVSLLLLLKLLDRERFLPMLLCPSEGEVARRARDLGVEVHVLGKAASFGSLSAVRHALSWVKISGSGSPGLISLSLSFPRIRRP